ncbi:MAG: hypothetical protein M1812_000511 [Candelaria pacifica]|nr:MAG: hypothetical protein M1812_000511 [Candelaria pacifica]
MSHSNRQENAFREHQHSHQVDNTSIRQTNSRPSQVNTSSLRDPIPNHPDSQPQRFDSRNSKRKPTPSPLQSSETNTENSIRSASHSAESPSPEHQSFPRPPANHPYSSRSIFYSPSSHADQPRSPRERLDELLATEASNYSPPASEKNTTAADNNPTSGGGIALKAPSYSSLRNGSAPWPPSRRPGISPPTSPTSLNSTMSSQRPEPRVMPRTSSIDSAISSISSSASHSYKSSQDTPSSNLAEIGNLISAAGSPETVIQHLLKEKQSSAAQNAQLWRLVDKQRAMILGLNKDLERTLKDKERYRKKLKEQLALAPALPNSTQQHALGINRAQSESPALSERADELDNHSGSPREVMSNEARAQAASPLSDKKYSEDRSPVDIKINPDPMTPPLDQPLSPLQSPHEVVAPQPESSKDINYVQSATPVAVPVDSTQNFTIVENLQDAPLDKDVPATLETLTTQSNLPLLETTSTAPSLKIIEASPLVGQGERIMPPPRRAPPAPLNLTQQKPAGTHLQHLGPDDHSESEYDDILEVDEIPAFERGRRKTREEDDREREYALSKDKDGRSRSKKDKSTKPAPAEPMPSTVDQQQAPEAPMLSLRQAVALSPPVPQADLLSPSGSLASVLSQPVPEPVSTTERRVVAPPPMSPGLPTSPRPVDRPLNSPMPRMPRQGAGISPIASPPTSPRQGFVGLPLSPRAPRHPISLPSNTPMSLASPTLPKPSAQQPSSSAHGEHKTTPVDRATQSENPTEGQGSPGSHGSSHIYRGLVTDQYPDLLLPPNALPSIDVRVSSSRLRPSRHSYLPKSSDEEQIFTLGVFARSNHKELWRVEKALMALPQLDHQLKQSSMFKAKLPDRSLFSGHAPAKIDARRMALDGYLNVLLNTPMDDKTALIVCQFLSVDVIEPHGDESTVTGDPAVAEELTTLGPGGRPRKEGYLTKRGKNFGGWKARFFALEGPTLRYYESPGGPHLGTIKLQSAQIGKRSQPQSGSSPSRSSESGENQYRHAFLILEPKKKDSSSMVRHVLCAESDAERDEWVNALLQYVDYRTGEDRNPRSSVPRNGSGSGKTAGFQPLKSLQVPGRDSPDQFVTQSLQGMSYETTVAAEAPVRGSTPNRQRDETPSPPISNSQGSTNSAPQISPTQTSMKISGPTNGGFIADAEAWGNKPQPQQISRDKDHKKRSIWGFKGRSPSDLANQPETNGNSSTTASQQSTVERAYPVRAVFGVPLGEAAEYCRPVGVDVYLPAVVYRSIEYLDAKGASSEEGIFRLSGSNVVIKNLRERFNTEGDVDFLADGHYYDVHAVASLLKLYLRELPSTVLTRELHLEFLQVLELDEKSKKIAAYNALMHRLPPANWHLLKALSAFLLTIINNSDTNKMTVKNVGIVFSPTLNIPAPVFSMFLTEFDSIFEATHDGDLAKTVEVNVTAPPLTPEDIRSPRRQMFSEIPTPSYKQASFPSNQQSSQQDPHGQPSAYDVGFIPLQPTYEQPAFGQPNHSHGHSGAVTMPAPEYGSLNGALALDDPQVTKARRRESSMLLMGFGERKGSMPSVQESPTGEQILLKCFTTRADTDLAQGMVGDDVAFK